MKPSRILKGNFGLALLKPKNFEDRNDTIQSKVNMSWMEILVMKMEKFVWK